jgi:multiple sugar transport system permease protein
VKVTVFYHGKRLVTKSLFVLLVTILCLIFVTPFIVMLSTSFRTNSDAFTRPVSLFPRAFTLENFPTAMKVIPYWGYMGNTLFITALSIVGNVTTTPLVAYSLSKIKWKGAPVISGLLMATMMIPYTVTMIPLYRIYVKLHLTNSYVPLILPTFFGNSYFIIIVRQFIGGLSDSLLEAAIIDGASQIRRYTAIVLPLCKPALTTVAIYAFMNAWSDYLAPMIYISKKEKLTLSLGLQQFMGEYSTDWARLMAAAVIFVLPVVFFYIIFQRNFVQGISTSGLKA